MVSFVKHDGSWAEMDLEQLEADDEEALSRIFGEADSRMEGHDMCSQVWGGLTAVEKKKCRRMVDQSKEPGHWLNVYISWMQCHATSGKVVAVQHVSEYVRYGELLVTVPNLEFVNWSTVSSEPMTKTVLLEAAPRLAKMWKKEKNRPPILRCSDNSDSYSDSDDSDDENE